MTEESARVHTSRLSIPLDHPCFPGHFPGQPILPGVLLLARVMSTVQACLTPAWEGGTVYNVKFLASVAPGDQLEVRLTSTPSRPHEHRFSIHILKDDGDIGNDGNHQAEAVLACSGQLRLDKP